MNLLDLNSQKKVSTWLKPFFVVGTIGVEPMTLCL
jgi:hypothetical protein